jgi:protein HOOK3
MALSNLGVLVNAIGEESTSALAVLKSADDLISASLKTELDATRKQLEGKNFDNEQMKEQLMEALVSKDKIRKQLDDVVAAAAVAPPNGQAMPSPADSDDVQKPKKDDVEKNEKLRAALKQKIQVSRESS